MRDWSRPEQGKRCFDQLPSTLERLLTGASNGPVLEEPLFRERFERVVFVYFDAFGWIFLERHVDHPVDRDDGQAESRQTGRNRSDDRHSASSQVEDRRRDETGHENDQ